MSPPMSTVLQIRSQTGKSGDGRATLAAIDPATRGGKAAAFVAVGVVAALACIWIPIVHLITTWLFPVVGAVLAWKTWTTEATFAEAAAACPECGAALTLKDRGAKFPMREGCAGCSTQLEITQGV